MNIQVSKSIILITVLAGIQAGVPIIAAASMISVEHRVWGNAVESEYDETGINSPASGSANIDYYGSSQIASSSASDWSVNAFRSGDANLVNAYAQNTYIFMPSSREISISLNGVIGIWWFENQAKMTLTNLTNNTLVSSYYSPSYTTVSPFGSGENDMIEYQFSWNTAIDVSPEDVYKLVIYAGAHRGEPGYSSASLSLTLVPETGSALLAGMATLFMCGRRCRPESHALSPPQRQLNY